MKTAHKEIHNGMDTIDSRDIIARIEYLEELQEEANDAATEMIGDIETAEEEMDEWVREHNLLDILLSEELDKKQAQIEDMKENILSDEAGHPLSDDFGMDEATELKALKSLADEADSGDWSYGEQLISDSYFETFAREFADDIGAIPKNSSWPCTCIDWKEAAEELQQDYTEVDFDGVTYWVRS